MLSITIRSLKKISKFMIAILFKNSYRSYRHMLITIILMSTVLRLKLLDRSNRLEIYEVLNRTKMLALIEEKLREQYKLDKGMGCKIPILDPYSMEVTQFDKHMPKVTCDGQDWVRCHCRVIREILDTYPDVSCTYRDILYDSDDKYTIGSPVEVKGADVYHLTKSDHIKISCTGNKPKLFLMITPAWWSGYAAGFRSDVTRVPSPKDCQTLNKKIVDLYPEGREDTLNILIFAFDSTARTGFIRRMPKSYRYLTNHLHATVLKSYNIIGDGTSAALFPILTGKNELELPDARKIMNNNTCDDMPFIFYKLKDDGYRTMYLEDSPSIGTFQFRLNGFRRQPADHYLRAFMQEIATKGSKQYCVGDTPQYKLMMNLTDQFMHLDGKKFALTFVADITHDDFNMISTADEDFVEFMKRFKNEGFLRDTMLMVMGDHGPRFTHVRNTLQGKLEERLPLMALVVPERMRTERPPVLHALQHNVHALSTPYDIHATLLDALQLRRYWNPHKVSGASLPRGMTLFEPISHNRSCSEAGIEPHWCACLAWQNVSLGDPLYQKTAEALVNYINSLTEPVRSKCAIRTLVSVPWVMKQIPYRRIQSIVESKDRGVYVHKFGEQIRLERETYQVKVTVDPAESIFEASMTYLVDKEEFHIDIRDISRINRYGSQSACISQTLPHLNFFCYCLR